MRIGALCVMAFAIGAIGAIRAFVLWISATISERRGTLCNETQVRVCLPIR